MNFPPNTPTRWPFDLWPYRENNIIKKDHMNVRQNNFLRKFSFSPFYWIHKPYTFSHRAIYDNKKENFYAVRSTILVFAEAQPWHTALQIWTFFANKIPSDVSECILLSITSGFRENSVIGHFCKIVELNTDVLEPSLLSEIANWSLLFKMSLKPNGSHALISDLLENCYSRIFGVADNRCTFRFKKIQNGGRDL